MNFDIFDLIVRVHSIFGLKYYGYYEAEKKCKIISHALHQIIIYSLILYLCSPCLINDINCKKSIMSSTDKSFRQIMIYLVIRNSIVFLSMITFSLRGKKFRKLVEDFRKSLSILHKRANGRQLFKVIYISIIIFCSFSIFESILLSVFFHSEERVLSLKTIYLFIAELHLTIIHFSTDFYVLYFTSYLVILQKLFKSELKEYNNQRIIITEKSLANIKFKLDSIQSLVEKVSKLLSPILLFICGAIFYDLVSCLYFTIKSIEFSAYFKAEYLVPNFGLFGNILRLICICFCAERLVFQVLFKILKIIFNLYLY
jgi:hypothetical protein